MKVFDLLSGLLREKAASANDLAAGVERARAALSEAEAAVADIAAGRRKVLAGSESARAAHRQNLRAAEEARDDAQLFLEELEARYHTAAADEEQARRSAAYKAALAASRKAQQALEAEYPAIAGRFLELQRVLAEARQAVQQVNAALPDGADFLADPEAVVRDLPVLPAERRGERVVTVWAFEDGGIIGEGAEVKDKGGGRGQLTHQGSVYPVKRRKARVMESLAYEGQQLGPRLAWMELPPLRAGSPDIWRQRKPEDCAGILDQVKTANIKGTTRPPREMVVTRELIPEPEEVPSTP